MTTKRRLCLACEKWFTPRRPEQITCSRRCANRWVARETAAARGDAQRGRQTTGRGRYPKYMGEPAHRAKLEEALGRKLEPNEIAHHLNGDKTDFRKSNLMVVTKGGHSRLEAEGERRAKRRGQRLWPGSRGE